MNPVSMAISELTHRWKSSFLVALIVAAITGALIFFTVNNAGFQREVRRNVRDIGSNVVILPADVDQFQYHSEGGYSEKTMSEKIVQQLVEFKASLNHLIPMLERKTECQFESTQVNTRVVGIAASIPVPGRPKAPMQKSIPAGKIQLGSQLAEQLGIGRDEKATVSIMGQTMEVDRVNRSNGTWQDSAALIDLKTAQTLFASESRISRIEAIECTDEQCAATGLKSDVVLANELARVTDKALLLRREKMAQARSNVRAISEDNLELLQNVLWVLLVVSLVGLASLNASQRKSEVGVLQAVGFGQNSVVILLILRAVILSAIGSLAGILIGSYAAYSQSFPLFAKTGKKFAIDWQAGLTIGIIAILLAALASCLPAALAAYKNPADTIGKES